MTKGELTRQRIVEQAAAIFNRRGYESGSLSELMAATGLKKGGIYRYFESKEALAAEAFDYSWTSALETRRPDVDPEADAIGWVKALVDNFVTRRPPVPGGCPLFNTAVEADDGNVALRARASKALRDWRTRITDVLTRAAASGLVPSLVDPRGVATVVIASLEGALMMSRLERNDDALRRVQAHLHSYLDALVARR